jgi:hypothetical protein
MLTAESERCPAPSSHIKAIQPCMPKPAKEPPAGPEWIHEIKHDGFRILEHRDGKGVRRRRSDRGRRQRRLRSAPLLGSATTPPCSAPSMCSSSTDRKDPREEQLERAQARLSQSAVPRARLHPPLGRRRRLYPQASVHTRLRGHRSMERSCPVKTGSRSRSGRAGGAREADEDWSAPRLAEREQ